jgi:uncharacterized protein
VTPSWLTRKRAWVALFAFTAITAISIPFVVKLFANLRPDLEELLPTTSRSVRDLNEVTTRLRSIDNIAILISTEKHPQEAGLFQEQLAKRLEKLPETLVSGVEYRISEELAYFEARKALFIEPEDLSRLEVFVRNRIEFEKSIYNPVLWVLPGKMPEPKFDFKALERKYLKRTSGYGHLPDGVYSTPDGKERLILAYAPDQSNTTAHKLRKVIDETIADMKPKQYVPDIKIQFSGNVQDIIEEQGALIEDLGFSTIVVAILVSFVLFAFFQSIFATVSLIVSLTFGTIWTFAISYFVVGYLNANSAFMGPIVMGNGINFGIIFLARYLEERRKGQTSTASILFSAKGTWSATLTASLAAGLAYGSLVVTQFRGFSQFGVIGLIGMVMCWISAYFVLPILLLLFDRKPSLEKSKSWLSRVRVPLESVVARHPKKVVAVGLAITIVASIGALQINRGLLETDLTKLRDKRVMESGSGFLTKKIDKILKRETSPMAVLAHSRDDAKKIAERLRERKRAQGSDSLIASVLTLEDFVPTQQGIKIATLKRIKNLLRPGILFRLDSAERRRVSLFLTPEALEPFSEESLPRRLVDRFREKNGAFGNLVLIEPPITRQTAQGDKLIQLVRDIRNDVDSVSPGTPVAGRLPVSADMIDSILSEGPIATATSAIAVLLLVILLFRRIAIWGWVVMALLIGILWMVGFVALVDLKVNFLNFIAFPITFGIGVDYALNVFQRFREERSRPGVSASKAVIHAVRSTGGAVALASLTTIIGWGSLLIAGNQAFVSFGRLAVLGELTCVFVAVWFVPSLIQVLNETRAKGH